MSRPGPNEDWLADRNMFSPDELEAVVVAGRTFGALTALAHNLGRPPQVVYAKARELKKAAAARVRSGAFLPDNGLPYRVVAQRLLRG